MMVGVGVMVGVSVGSGVGVSLGVNVRVEVADGLAVSVAVAEIAPGMEQPASKSDRKIVVGSIFFMIFFSGSGADIKVIGHVAHISSRAIRLQLQQVRRSAQGFESDIVLSTDQAGELTDQQPVWRNSAVIEPLPVQSSSK